MKWRRRFAICTVPPFLSASSRESGGTMSFSSSCAENALMDGKDARNFSCLVCCCSRKWRSNHVAGRVLFYLLPQRPQCKLVDSEGDGAKTAIYLLPRRLPSTLKETARTDLARGK